MKLKASSNQYNDIVKHAKKVGSDIWSEWGQGLAKIHHITKETNSYEIEYTYLADTDANWDRYEKGSDNAPIYSILNSKKGYYAKLAEEKKSESAYKVAQSLWKTKKSVTEMVKEMMDKHHFSKDEAYTALDKVANDEKEKERGEALKNHPHK